MGRKDQEVAMAYILGRVAEIDQPERCALLDSMITAADFFISGQRHGYEKGYEAGMEAARRETAQC